MTGVHQPDRGEILLDGKPVAHPQRRRGAAPRHRRDLPGADDLPRPQRGREHLHQPPGPRRRSSTGGRCTARPRRSSPQLDVALDVREPGARPDAGRAADGRDRQGDLAQRPRPDHGRADGLALGPRGRPALPAGHATCATRASPSSSSATAWRRSSRSPTGSPCFRDGRLISTRPRAEVDAAARHRRHGRPRDRDFFAAAAGAAAANCVLSVRGLGREGVFHDVTFDVHRGEVLGFAGLIGAGRTDVGLALFGIAPADRRRRSCSTASRAPIRSPARGDGARHRLRLRGPPPARPVAADVDRRQHLAADAASATSTGFGLIRTGDGARHRRSLPPAARDPHAVGRPRRSPSSPAATSRR